MMRKIDEFPLPRLLPRLRHLISELVILLHR